MILDKLLGRKCKFIKTCKWYAETSPTCNKDGGQWGAWNKMASCWIRNQEESKRKKHPDHRMLEDFGLG